MRRVALALVAVAATAPAARAGEWEIDPANSAASFSVRHMMVSDVRGQFGKGTGTVTLDDKDPTRSAVSVEIDASTIDTREPKRDAHLRSTDFFDVQKYPTISFRSTRIERAGKQRLKLTGDLT